VSVKMPKVRAKDGTAVTFHCTGSISEHGIPTQA
jgi:hypothetical protein